MTPEIITQAVNAKKEIKRINAETDAACTKLSEQARAIHADYRKRVKALEDEQSELTEALDNKRYAIRSETSAKMDELNEPVERLDEIFKLMGLMQAGNKDLTLIPRGGDDDKYYYSRYEPKLIDTPISNKYLNLQAYTYRTGKSNSKYALCLAGRSMFGGIRLIDYPYHNVSLDFKDYNPSILVHLKGSNTKEWLEKWWEKNKKKAMGDLWNIAEHKALVEQYKWVETHCNTLEWTLAHLVSKRDAYESQRNKRYLENDDYKKIIKEIVNTKWYIYSRDKKNKAT